MISYEDFDLRIRADGSGFVVEARRGDQTAREPLALDLTRSWDLGHLAARGRSEIEEAGAKLFEALMRGQVRDLYHQGRGAAGGNAAKGLRIRLLLDPRDERLRPILQLPWEILFDRSANAGGLLALDPRRPIVRTIDTVEETLAPTEGKLERVLLALSNPHHSTPLELDHECSQIKEILGRIPLYPEVLQPATRDCLDRSISYGHPQIVHFMGHGDMDPKIGEGVLLLEDEDGYADPIPASTFASFFVGKSMPRLVILTSCSSAETRRDPSFGPFASVAAALVAAGLPAVIAMQTVVADRSALRFTERLYESVVDGDPVESAVSKARKALRAGRADTLDWAVPVLFVRGRIDPVPSIESPISQPPASPQQPDPEGRQIVVNHGDVKYQQNFGSVQNLYQDWKPGEK